MSTASIVRSQIQLSIAVLSKSFRPRARVFNRIFVRRKSAEKNEDIWFCLFLT